jgi:methionine synthase II (cobalamin-independent)
MKTSSHPKFHLSGMPTAIGSMPHTDTGAACALIMKYLPEIPFWPQLPKRSFLENMYAQYSEGFPGLVIDTDKIYVNLSQGLEGPLEELYTAYVENKINDFAISKEYAAGLHEFLEHSPSGHVAVKGHITGPFTWGMTVTDENRRPILYDDTAADAVVKHLNMKARWQETRLREIADNTILFFDEPYMSAAGSAFVSMPRERIIELIDGVLEGIGSLKGVHCCGNTDWSIIMSTSIDIINFDAYSYGHTIALYTEVKDFIEQGGVLAWGIVPREDKALESESVKNLMDRLIEGMASLERKGISKSKLLEQSLLTPSCGLEPASLEAAERALELLAELSTDFRKKYINL